MPSLRVILDRFDHDRAVFLTQEGQQLVWHKDDLPEDLKEGSTYYVHFAKTDAQPTTPIVQQAPAQTPKTPPKQTPSKPPKPLSEKEKQQRLMAKAILEELLNGTEPPTKNTVE